MPSPTGWSSPARPFRRPISRRPRRPGDPTRGAPGGLSLPPAPGPPVPAADHYRVLGLSRRCSAESIKQHHGLLVRMFHPDRSPETDERRVSLTARINAAYQVLRDPEARRRYDRQLGPVLSPSSGGKVLDWLGAGTPVVATPGPSHPDSSGATPTLLDADGAGRRRRRLHDRARTHQPALRINPDLANPRAREAHPLSAGDGDFGREGSSAPGGRTRASATLERDDLSSSPPTARRPRGPRLAHGPLATIEPSAVQSIGRPLTSRDGTVPVPKVPPGRIWETMDKAKLKMCRPIVERHQEHLRQRTASLPRTPAGPTPSRAPRPPGRLHRERRSASAGWRLHGQCDRDDGAGIAAVRWRYADTSPPPRAPHDYLGDEWREAERQRLVGAAPSGCAPAPGPGANWRRRPEPSSSHRPWMGDYQIAKMIRRPAQR